MNPKLVELAVDQNFLQAEQVLIDAMIGAAVLGEVVGPNPIAAVTAAHH